MKKVTAIFMAVLLLAALFCTSASAAGPLNITVSTVDAHVGDEVTVTVNFSDNPGIAAMSLGIGYDETVLEKVSFEGTGLSDITVGTNAVWVDENGTTYNGDVLVLKFKVKSDATPGMAAVTINPLISDIDENSVAANVVAGGVNIICEHEWNAGEVTTEPNCETAGVKTFACAKCGQTRTEEIAAPGHNWNEGEITTPASCTAEGVKTFTCSVCGGTRTEAVPMTEHQTEIQNAKPATCTEKGYSGDKVCKVCGNVVEAGSELALAEHSWDKGTVTKEASCTEKGVKTFTCSVCGGTRTEEIPMAAHQTELKNAKPATCTEKGYSGDKVCKVCGNTVETGKELALAEHSWDKGTVTKEATCTEKGAKLYKCANCDVEKTEEIAALGHKWDNGKVTKEPTNKETGIKTYTCSVCGSTKTETLPVVAPDSKPKTGDESSVALWATLLFLSGSSAAAFALKRRKADHQ